MIKTNPYKFSIHGWVGLSLLLVSWILNWSLNGARTHLLFFPLWLGYCLTIDALALVRKGSSLWSRNRKAYIGLFLVSAPAWWLFEVINWRTQNWFYTGRECFSDLEYFLFASLNFSTVIPAVFGTAEFVSTFKWIKRLTGGPLISDKRSSVITLFILGGIMLFSLLYWPRYCFTFVWTSVYLIIDSINVRLGHRSLIHYTTKRDWRPVLALWVGCLICGFFWEMWNFYSDPKWIYRVPFVDFWHIFEMPVLGYLGYLPFALELFAIYHFIIGIFQIKKLQDYIQII